jgi:L-ribulokinase
MTGNDFVIGVDFGTDSVRSVVVDASSGQEIAASVFQYPRWRDGLYCDVSKNQFRQHPLDYVEGLLATIPECLNSAGPQARKRIRAISIDTTGSTPVAVDKAGTPLSLLPAFKDNPDAMFVLWKDHTAVHEAAQINEHAKRYDVNYLQYVGGIYSTEWFWAKLLYILRHSNEVRQASYSWVEHCDWVPYLLTGGSDVSELKRGVCAAGHKALWAQSFGGLPPDNFFSSLDPLLSGFTTRLFSETFTSSESAGTISKQWSERLGVPADVRIGVGAFDCHMGAVGGQIEPFYLSKVMGTSTCDMMVVPRGDLGDKLVKGICGQVDGSIIPGMIGLEAGQSAFGDTYAWYKNLLMWPIKKFLGSSSDVEEKIIAALSEEASRLSFDESSELAIDWLNGRRTPDADQTLTGAMVGLNLASDAPRLFRAWVEATCFGAKAIMDRFNEEGVPVKGLIGLGGVARKSPYIMQVMASVMNKPLKIHRSEQTCALGAAMFAATVAGIYPNVEEAMNTMGQGFDITYTPEKSSVSVYERRFQRYNEFTNRAAAKSPLPLKATI